MLHWMQSSSEDIWGIYTQPHEVNVFENISIKFVLSVDYLVQLRIFNVSRRHFPIEEKFISFSH